MRNRGGEQISSSNIRVTMEWDAIRYFHALTLLMEGD